VPARAIPARPCMAPHFPFAGRGWTLPSVNTFAISLNDVKPTLSGRDGRPEVGGVSARALGAALPPGGAIPSA
jgi:hypothetical protein